MSLHDKAAGLLRLGAWECDLASERLTWTDGVFDLFGLPLGVAPRRRDIVDLYEDGSRQEMELLRREAIRTGRGFELDIHVRTIRGQRRWLRLTAAVEQENGRSIRLFGAKRDITREREEWARLRAEAENDPLTGLANRRTFERHLREVAQDHLHHAGVAALALIDLDRFKAVNDRFGHAAGDACLRQVAERLRRAFPDAALVSRIGGDEFAVLLRSPLGELRLAQVLRRASAALSRSVAWHEGCLEIGASIGASLVQASSGQLARIFDEADSALYAAKASGINQFHIFDPRSGGRLIEPSGDAPARLAAG